MLISDRTVFRTSLAAFLILWLYVILRAIYVSPLHDEVATYFHYIESGLIWGDNANPDANNHLLNSILGRLSYRIFGESFFAFRLPNVLSFVLYFWGIYYLIKELPAVSRILALTGITSIPYILEYFSYTRGYGMSMGFFAMMLVFAHALSRTFNLRHLILLLVCAFLAILSNLSLLGIICLTVAFILFQYSMCFRSMSTTRRIFSPLILLGFICGLYPVFSLAFRMKKLGTLYYGSLDGFWEVTGKSLSRYILFYEENFLAILFCVIFAIILIVQLRQLTGKGLLFYLESKEGIVIFYLVGAICIILLLAKAFQINYPEDRVGMYLVPLTLLAFAFSFFRRFQWISLLFLAFPVSLFFHLSFSTSVFTPDERFTDEFYNRVKAKLTEDMILAGNPTMELTWALHERKAVFKNYMNPDRAFLENADVIVLKSGDIPRDHEHYNVFASDPEAGYLALIRTKKMHKKPLAMISLGEMSSSAEYLEFANMQTQDSWRGKTLLFSIKGTLERKGNTPIETVVLSSGIKENVQPVYRNLDLRWYNGITKSRIPFNMQVQLIPRNAANDDFKVYVWNKFMYPMRISDCIVTVYELQPDDQ